MSSSFFRNPSNAISGIFENAFSSKTIVSTFFRAGALRNRIRSVKRANEVGCGAFSAFSIALATSVSSTHRYTREGHYGTRD